MPPSLCVSHEKRGSRTQGLQSRRHPPPVAAADRSATAVDYFRGAKRQRSHRDPDDPLQQEQYPEPSGSEGAHGSAAAQPDPRLAAAFYTTPAAAQGDPGWRWRGQYSHGAQPLFAAQSHAAASGSPGHTVVTGASAAAQDVGFGQAVGFSGAQSVQEGDVRWAAGPTPQQYHHHAGAAAQTAAAVQQQQRQHGQDGQNDRQDWARGNGVAGGGGHGGQQSCAAQQVSIAMCYNCAMA